MQLHDLVVVSEWVARSRLLLRLPPCSAATVAIFTAFPALVQASTVAHRVKRSINLVHVLPSVVQLAILFLGGVLLITLLTVSVQILIGVAATD